MGEVLVEQSRWPLVVVNWPARPATDDDVEAVLEALGKCYGRFHAVLHDGVRAGGLDARQRQRIAKHVGHYEDEIRRWVIASAAVAPSPLVRGLITAIQWLAPSPCPFKAFAQRAEAEEWLLLALRRAGAYRPSPSP